MPASWRYMMIVLVACLIASMVIAVVRARLNSPAVSPGI